MTGDIVVEAVGLGYDYVSPPVCALRGVSFELRRGAFLAVMGPNGSGKSTLVRAVLGLLRPTRGSIRVAGREAWEYRREIQRIIGYVPQHDSVNQHLPMCPRDIVGLAASTRGVGRGGHGNLTARVNDALAMVGMADLAHRPFGSLSGGQQQRVA
ncbi:MAG TPA: ATP-binding cassette domain-containing protein, partial [Armatimonadota bacterium]|nr:ATP-binding cassette domain-containing protein [Armatimonadota bacterium]